MKNKTNTFNLCCGALMTAMICIMTMVIQIPIPIGYVHLGDAFILLAALLLNRREAMLAAGLGSALADFLTGYVQWSVPTFFIKTIIALIAGYFFYNNESKNNESKEENHIRGNARIFGIRHFLGAVLSMAWMVVGYVFFGSILYGSVVTGIASAPGLIAKAVVNIAVYYLLAGLLEKAHVRRFIEVQQ